MPQVVHQDIFERMVSIRRDLHQHPELSLHEHRTSERVATVLEELGIRHRRIAETGIVADIPGPDGTPRVALRADMDALPIQEETGLPFASVHDGVMHACGHDGHTTMLLGAAELLVRQDLQIPVRLIFQPAEEKALGAKAMIDGGAVDDVAMIFGGHLDRNYATGNLVVTAGAVNASTDSFHIRFSGQGGHAARPHEAVDAVVVGSLMVTALQTIVSREINPAYPSVVTVGRFHGGTASNVIAGLAELEGTIRAQEPTVRDHLMRSVQRIAESVAELHGAEVTVEFLEGTPAVINVPDMVAVAREAAERVVGPQSVQELAYANMGAEDFSYYLEKVPGCYIRFGAQDVGRQGFPAHSSKFDFDEKALAFGAAWLCEVVRVAGSRAGTAERQSKRS